MIGAMVSYEAERLTVGKLVHQIKNQDKKNTGYLRKVREDTQWQD